MRLRRGRSSQAAQRRAPTSWPDLVWLPRPKAAVWNAPCEAVRYDFNHRDVVAEGLAHDLLLALQFGVKFDFFVHHLLCQTGDSVQRALVGD